MFIKRLLVSAATLVSALAAFSSQASAHAPLEWSDPKSDSVVAALPSEIRFRFEEDPRSVTITALGTGMKVTPVKTAPRTYRAPLPNGVLAPGSSTLVLMMAITSQDGHIETGPYLLHILKPTTTLAAAPPTTPAVGSAPTTSVMSSETSAPTHAVFVPPTKSRDTTERLWIALTCLAALNVLLVLFIHKKLRGTPHRQGKNRTQGSRTRSGAKRH